MCMLYGICICTVWYGIVIVYVWTVYGVHMYVHIVCLCVGLCVLVYHLDSPSNHSIPVCITQCVQLVVHTPAGLFVSCLLMA